MRKILIMFQRPQTLYIILGVLFQICSFRFLSYLNCYNPNQSFYFDSNWYGTIFIIVMAFVTIFSFKNRKTQIKLIYILVFLSFLIPVITVFLIPAGYPNLWTELAPECNINLLSFLSFSVAIILYLLSIRLIKKDDDLINSINRLR